MNAISTFDAVLLGALGMASMILVVIVAVVAVWKVWPLLVVFKDSIPRLEKAVAKATTVMDAIQRELAYMRSLTPQPTPNFGGDPGSPAAGQEPTAPPQPTPFPAPVFDRFQVMREEPDATIQDTDSGGLTQTDEDLVRMEALENLRQKGMQVEDSDTEHEGIEVESE